MRAIRRVAEPLVFDPNGPVLWFMVARAISGVLLEAFRTGLLQGETPDQAYRVRCDEATNSQDVVDAGLVVCEIEIAPAVPMEFITLRLTLGAQGLLIGQAVVVGVADPVLGTALHAIVVASDGQLAARDVLRHCARALPDHMVPRTVQFRAALPTTASGKVSRRAAATARSEVMR